MLLLPCQSDDDDYDNDNDDIKMMIILNTSSSSLWLVRRGELTEELLVKARMVVIDKFQTKLNSICLTLIIHSGGDFFDFGIK